VIVSSAVANLGFVLETSYTVFSLAEAEALGIIPSVAGNYELHKTIKEFMRKLETVPSFGFTAWPKQKPWTN
jgi:hypothetical protein